MVLNTIRVKDSTYEKLIKRLGQLTLKENRLISMDEVIIQLLTLQENG